MKISVVLPVYNAAPWLGRCLDSLSAQTFRDFEVIAVDDGSTDGSDRMLDDYVANFPMIRLHQTNQGASVARNVALEKAAGDYVFMADADDFLHPQALELVVGVAEEAKADFVVFDYWHASKEEVDGSGNGWFSEQASVSWQDVGTRPLDWFVGGRRMPTLWQFLFRRDSLSGCRFVPGIMFEDNPFIYSYLASGPRGVYVAKELYCYVKTAGSVMRRTSLARKIRSLETVMRELDANVCGRDFRMLVREEYFPWIKRFWRQVRGTDSELTAVRPEFDAFLSRLMRDRLIRLGDCPLKWILRFWSATVRRGLQLGWRSPHA